MEGAHVATLRTRDMSMPGTTRRTRRRTGSRASCRKPTPRTRRRTVRRIEEICERERIDTIFPSSDAEVYVFSKNKPRFAQRGVVCVVQDYETLSIPLDKFETNQAARRVGLPAPDAIIPDSPEQIRAFAERVDPPWLVKPRCTYGGIGTTIVSYVERISSPTYYLTAQRQARPMIQEFIPGRVKESIYLLTDHHASIRSLRPTRS